MATRVRVSIEYEGFHYSNPYHRGVDLRKVWVQAEGIVVVKYIPPDDTQAQVVKFDTTGLPLDVRTPEVDHSQYANYSVPKCTRTTDDFSVNMRGKYDAAITGGTLRSSGFRVFGWQDVTDYSSVTHIFTHPDETEGVEAITVQTPSWFPDPNYEYQQAQKDAIRAIGGFRYQCGEWLVEALRRSHLASTVIDKTGKWLKAADAALKKEFQDPNVPPAVVAEMARLASQGALDITSVDEFVRGVHYAQSTPANALLWVQTEGDPTDPDSVVRVNLSEAVDYGAGSLPASYDPLQRDWLIENQAGVVTIDDTTPITGQQLMATLTDPDGGVESVTWQWANKTIEGDWTPIAGATAETYTPVAADAGKYLRAIATYNDNHSDGNTAISQDTGAVAQEHAGTIALDDTTPVVGTKITATLTDANTPVSNQIWQWQSRDTGTTAWNNIANATNDNYTPVTADLGKELRLMVTYTDALGPNKTATSDATTAVA